MLLACIYPHQRRGCGNGLPSPRRRSVLLTAPTRWGTDHCGMVVKDEHDRILMTHEVASEHGEEAKQLWKWRWSLLKKPANMSGEEKQAMAALAREDAGFVHRFRSILRQLVNIFDSSHSEAHAKLKLQQLRQEINAVDDAHLQKI